MKWERVTNYNIGSGSNYASKNKSIMRGLAYHRKIYKKLEEWQPKSAPDQVLYIEPWFRGESGKMCQPDAALIDPISNTGLIIEVKMNWKDGRDEKLLNLYLHAAKSAFGLVETWPALITSNVQGYKGIPRLGLGSLLSCDDWTPGQLTPLILVP